MITFLKDLQDVPARYAQYIETCSWHHFIEPLDNTQWPEVGVQVHLLDSKQKLSYTGKVVWRHSCPGEPGDMCWGIDVDPKTREDI